MCVPRLVFVSASGSGSLIPSPEEALGSRHKFEALGICRRWRLRRTGNERGRESEPEGRSAPSAVRRTVLLLCWNIRYPPRLAVPLVLLLFLLLLLLVWPTRSISAPPLRSRFIHLVVDLVGLLRRCCNTRTRALSRCRPSSRQPTTSGSLARRTMTTMTTRCGKSRSWCLATVLRARRLSFGASSVVPLVTRLRPSRTNRQCCRCSRQQHLMLILVTPHASCDCTSSIAFETKKLLMDNKRVWITESESESTSRDAPHLLIEAYACACGPGAIRSSSRSSSRSGTPLVRKNIAH